MRSSWILLLAVLSACGGSPLPQVPLSPDQPQPAQAVSSPVPQPEVLPATAQPPVKQMDIAGSAKNLGLRILPEASDVGGLDMPDPAAALDHPSEWDDFTIEGNEILVHTKLYLQDPHAPNPIHKRRFYFVWPENSLGSPLSSASFSHRILNKQNKLIGSLKPKRVWHDTERHRWFIPLRELFRDLENYSEADVSLEDTQILTLELALENGPNVVIQIRFQVSGPFPVTEVTEVELKAPGELTEFVKTTSNQGWEVKREKIVNPMPRSFTLWLRTRLDPSSLKMSTYLSSPSYTEQAEAPPLGPHWNRFKSIGALQMDTLKVRHEGGQGETLRMRGHKWVSVSLNPSETITLEWWAKPSPETVDCVLPQTQVMNLNWLTVHPQTYHWEVQAEAQNALAALGFNHMLPHVARQIPDPVVPPTLNSQAVSIDWTLRGASILGNWGREIRLVHPFTSKDDATRDQADGGIEYLTLNDSGLEASISVGESENDAADFGCQGVFK